MCELEKDFKDVNLFELQNKLKSYLTLKIVTVSTGTYSLLSEK